MIRQLSSSALLATALVLVGCAALTVDVDVYKGPLANDAHVQIEQTASLAMGAKPLLIQLRDRLEIPKEKERLDWQLHRLSKTDHPEHRPAYIRDGQLHNDYARQVNAVLSLYEDLERGLPAPIQRQLEALEGTLRTYARAEALLNPDAVQVEVVQAEWENLRNRARDHRKDDFSLYTAFAAPDADVTFRPYTPLFKALDASTEFDADARLPRRDSGANGAFAWLADQVVLDSLAEYFFASSEAQQAFTESALVPAEAFLDARRALDAALEETLLIIIGLTSNTDQPLDEVSREKAVTTLAILASELLSNSGVRKAGLHSLVDKQARTRQLLHRPLETAETLLQAHYTARASGDIDSKYGIASGPVPRDALDNAASAPDSLLRLADAASGGQGLENGRPAQGIERLIEEYVEARMDLRYVTHEAEYRSDEERQRASDMIDRRDRLFVALTHFAEKVRVIANYSQLVDDSVDDREREFRVNQQRILQAISTALLSQIDDLRKYQTGRDTRAYRVQAETEAANAAWRTSAEAAAKAVVAALEAEKLTGDEQKKTADDKLTRITTLKTAVDAVAPWVSAGAAVTVRDLILTQVSDTAALTIRNAVNALPGTIEEIHGALKAVSPEGDALIIPTDAEVASKLFDALLGGVHQHLNGVTQAERDATIALLEARRGAYTESLLARWAAQRETASLHADVAGAATAWAAELNAEMQASTTKSTEATDRADRLTTSLALAKAHRAGFVEGLSSSADAGAEVADAFAAYLSALASPLSTAPDAAKKAEISNAVEDVLRHRGATPPLPPVDEPRESLDVVDAAIAGLEHRRASALAMGNDDQATSLQKAAEALRQRRADLLHIRPSSAYLRNSYAVTSFQRTPPLALRNILTSDGSRSSDVNSATASDIDRQFWQNINRVYLKGGGATNYAVIRDDIGNFVVKQYSSNPQKIIDSGKALARFTMAGVADPGALVSTLPETDADGLAPSAARSAELGPVGRQLQSIDRELVKQQLASYRALARIARDANSAFDPGLLPSGNRSLKNGLSDPMIEQLGRDDFQSLLEGVTLDIDAQAEAILRNQSSSQPIPSLGRYDPANAASVLSSMYTSLRTAVATANFDTAVGQGNPDGTENTDLDELRAEARDLITAALGAPLLEYTAKRRASLNESSSDLQLVGAAAE